jgi:putative membrane protein
VEFGCADVVGLYGGRCALSPDDRVLGAIYGGAVFYMHGIGWGWWLLMSIGMVAFWGLVIYGIVWLVRGQSSQPREPEVREHPDDVLKQRLARGEISIDEYDQLRQALEARPREPHPV